MNQNGIRTVPARLRIEAVLKHWGLDVSVTATHLAVRSDEFTTHIVMASAAAGVRVVCPDIFGRKQIREVMPEKGTD